MKPIICDQCGECQELPEECLCDSCPICKQLNPVNDRSKCGCDICEITGRDYFDEAYQLLQEDGAIHPIVKSKGETAK